MRIFLTGATGYLGGSLAVTFIGAGHHVRGLTLGPGKNVWSNVHLADACDLYLRALDGAAPGSFLFVENGEAAFREIAEAVAGALRLPPPLPIGIEDAIEEWGFEPAVFALGSNSRVRGVASRRDLDWRPQHTSVTDWITRSLA